MTPNPWTVRIWREFHADNLTRAYRDVLLTLRTYRGAGGLIHPSHATLADRAGCCVRTVQRALEAAADLGLLTWVERRVRAGWRWLRTSNRYVLTLPEDPVQPGALPRFWPRRATTGQNGRGGESVEKEEAREDGKGALEEMLRAAARLPDLLAARNTALKEGWMQFGRKHWETKPA